MQKRHTDRLQYFLEQDFTTRTYVIPFIRNFREFHNGMKVLEIGCGEGGNLKPFLDAGCLVTGIDLSDHKIGLARSFFENHPQRHNLELICEDIYHLETQPEKFDILIMRDVIEHIHNQEKFMSFIKSFTHPGSVFFLAFPPWQNPFGGHQQICRNKIPGHLPWFHLFPVPVYRWILRTCGESEATVENLMEVKETGISIERFERIVKKQSYRILAKKFFLVNPNYRVKFGMRPVTQAGWIAAIPGFRNILTTSAYYLLSPGRIT